MFLLKGKKLFVLRHASDRSCALLVNKTEILVIGGYSSRFRKENIGDITSDQPWSSLYPDLDPAEGTHGKVHLTMNTTGSNLGRVKHIRI